MALVKCTDPDCGKQVSTMATVCPNCGAPVGDAINESQNKRAMVQYSSSAKSVFETRQELMRQMFPNLETYLSKHPEYADSHVCVGKEGALRRLSVECKDWINSIEVNPEMTGRQFCRFFPAFSNLQALDLGYLTGDGMDDESLLFLSKCRSLRLLKLPTILDKASSKGLTTLCNLKQLELLELPTCLGRVPLFETGLKKLFQERLPNTILK